MKLRKKLSQRNLDGMFRLILLIYGKIMKKVSVKIYTEQFKKFHECKFEKKWSLPEVQKRETINWDLFGILHAT